MREQTTPSINEAVNFLARHRPQVLEELSASLPALTEKHLLRPGRILGKEDSPVLLRSLAEVAKRSLEEQVTLLQERDRIVKGRMRLQRRTRLTGEIVTVISSASVVSFLAAEIPTWSLISGVMALIASLAVVVVEYLGGSDDPENGVHAVYFELVSLRGRALELVPALGTRIDHFDVANEWNTAVCDQLVREANKVAGRVNELLAKLP